MIWVESRGSAGARDLFQLLGEARMNAREIRHGVGHVSRRIGVLVKHRVTTVVVMHDAG